ncbi:hypothetical protein CC78DRAFT_611712 [Lojkania enalia]|uniref:SAP domain-containing protein n=1 Tax=Lojkania enalia TaxID=147567 RepID=A0A9P4NBL5_9PLEO|nr:hypothetical protein CC78DRAFT_611712 [Didymosphaeria enalia]
MTDYNKLTVANLRGLLKDRGIPSTGLTRKAQIIEKLEEYDQVDPSALAEAEGTPAVAQPEAEDQAVDTHDQAPPPEESTSEPIQPSPEPAPSANPTESTPPVDASATKQPEEQSIPAEQSAPEPAADVSDTASAHRDGADNDEPAAADPAKLPQPEPQTNAENSTILERTPSPDPNEKLSIEKPDLAPIPEHSANVSLEASRLNSEELEADRRKRKRRSPSPDPSTTDVKAKKPRQSEDGAPDVYLKEDRDIVMDQRPLEGEGPKEDANGVDEVGSKEEAPVPESSKLEEAPAEDSRPPIESKARGPRYKDLIQPSIAQESPSALVDDRLIAPALHPATPALYIRNFMRPLRPDPLRAHLVSLATPPSSEPDSSIITHIFLDSMKTHAFVLFTSTTAASRVRASLHGSVWPPERNRQELWVDFVPEDKARSWIKDEESAISAEKEARAAGKPIPTKRFEVVYSDTPDSGTQAIFQEVGSGAPVNAPRGPRADARRMDQEAPPAPQDPQAKQDLGQSFQTLDTLFQSTTTKPKLYYLPVDDETSKLRLDELYNETARDWHPEDRVKGRGARFSRLDQKATFSFDSEDRIVEVGGDFGPWAEDRGEFRGRGRGGYRGGFRSDGFRGRYGGVGWRGG